MEKKRTNKRFFAVSIVAVAVVVLVLVICALGGVFTPDPLDRKVNAQTYEQDIEQVLETLSPADRTALVSGLMLSYYKQEKVEGRPYREFLERGREMKSDFMETVDRDMKAFLRGDSLAQDTVRIEP